MMTYQHVNSPSFTAARKLLHHLMKTSSCPVEVESWQGRDVRDRPDMRTHELLNVTLRVPLSSVRISHNCNLSSFDSFCYDCKVWHFNPMNVDHWREDIKPNLPWADEHFKERIGGEPLNPAPSWKNWPWSRSAAGFCDAKEVFDHTYPERFWPKYAGVKDIPQSPRKNYCHHGIRFPYGDLKDVTDLLVRQPLTRQAFLPIYFPEDTSPEAKRKPCTLGYQFIRRQDELHCYYPMRSCDLVRHWADDAYLAVRLVLWVIQECYGQSMKSWEYVIPGTLTMHMTSLHVFANDMREL